MIVIVWGSTFCLFFFVFFGKRFLKQEELPILLQIFAKIWRNSVKYISLVETVCTETKEVEQVSSHLFCGFWGLLPKVDIQNRTTFHIKPVCAETDWGNLKQFHFQLKYSHVGKERDLSDIIFDWQSDSCYLSTIPLPFISYRFTSHFLDFLSNFDAEYSFLRLWFCIPPKANFWIFHCSSSKLKSNRRKFRPERVSLIFSVPSGLQNQLWWIIFLFTQNYFRRHAPCETAPYGINPEVMDTYVKSCGMCS